MYHLPDNPRVQRSAELILTGLAACLREKTFTEITVSDVHRASGVSRATFYRIFDNLCDVLCYGCDQLVRELDTRFGREFQGTKDGFLTFSLACCMEHSDFLETLSLCHRDDLLQSSMVENSRYMREYLIAMNIPPDWRDYLSGFACAALCSTLMIWVRRGKRENAAELADIFYKIVSIFPRL